MTAEGMSREMTGEKAVASPPVLVELRDMTKTYGPTRANDGVSMALARGEIIGLVGGNGAGKSTLMRMLCGETVPDSGSIALAGEAAEIVRGLDAATARRHGIRIVHQELSLCDNLTVAENFFLEAPAGARALSRWRREYRRRALAALEAVFPGSSIDVDARVAGLSIAARQMVEIARALAAPDARIVILDEPTSSLALDRSRQLREHVARRAAAGMTFVFISHKLQEVMSVATRMAVMRNGRMVWEGTPAESSISHLVALMGGDAERGVCMGKDVTASGDAARVMVRITGDGVATGQEEIALHAGEIVGLAGLEGSGQKELLHAMFTPARGTGVHLAPGARSSFVSGDRQRDGIFPLWSVLENISIGRLARRPGLALFRADREVAAAGPAAERIRLDPGRLKSGILDLSGGNQQKALVARALVGDASVILLDDPMRGVDVAAKQDFYAAVADMARSGRLVVWHSTEDLEFLECDRVLVFSEGRIVRELASEAIREDAIVGASFEQADAADGTTSERGRRPVIPARALIEAAPFVSLAVVLAVMAWVNPLSMSFFGLDLLLAPALALVLVSLGQMFIIGGSEIDLGAGAFAGVINVLSATLLVMDPLIGALAILGVLIAYGALGALIQARRIPAIVVTLGASFIWLGIGYTLQPTPGGSSPPWLSAVFSLTFGAVPTPIVFILCVTLVAWFVNRTPTGVVLRAFGNNPQAMMRSGWSAIRHAVIRYGISALFLLAAGLSLTAINTASDINSGNSFTLLSVAAVVIGGCALFGGHIHPVGVTAGAMTLALIGALLGMLNVNSDYNAAAQGLLLLLILTFSAIVSRGEEEE